MGSIILVILNLEIILAYIVHFSLLDIFYCQLKLLSISNDQNYMRVGRRTTRNTLLLT